MSQFLANLPVAVLASLYFGIVGWALVYGLPLAILHAIRAPNPARLTPGMALAGLAVGAAILAGVLLYLGSVPFGAMPCGPRFPCPAGASFIYLSSHPLPYLFKAGPLACMLLFGMVLVIVGGRSLLSRGSP